MAIEVLVTGVINQLTAKNDFLKKRKQMNVERFLLAGMVFLGFSACSLVFLLIINIFGFLQEMLSCN